jgi:hypothetical protein
MDNQDGGSGSMFWPFRRMRQDLAEKEEQQKQQAHGKFKRLHNGNNLLTSSLKVPPEASIVIRDIYQFI